MQHVTSMVKNATPMQVVNASQADVYSAPAYQKLSHETSMLVNQLFSELQAIFPAWRNTFPNQESLDQAKRSWVKGFIDSGIKSSNQIKFGVRNARACKSPYWPSIGTFIDWCKPTPEAFGLPSREDAYSEAISNLGSYITAKWSHVAVQEAVRNTTSYMLKTASERASRAEFYRNYAVLVNRVMSGENLKFDVPKAITAKPTFKRAAPEVALSHLANMKKMVGLT